MTAELAAHTEHGAITTKNNGQIRYRHENVF